ncbi:MAG: CocE/NonD family hydrolase [Saprospiraceae bacterium]
MFFGSSLLAQESDADFIRSHYNKQEVLIPMRDGIKLFTSIYTPKEAGSYPFLLKRTPYSCSPYGENEFVGSFQNMQLARSGYIFVMQDVRGKYMSEGEFVDVRPFNPDKKSSRDIDEASDTYDTAEWLVKNVENNNGKIGVYGISYPGFYATMAILAQHPAIAAVSPQAPVTDWFIGDDFHHNGAFFQMDAFSFYSGFGQVRPEPTTKRTPGFSDWGTQDNYEFYLQVGTVKNFNEKYLHERIPFWNELMEHPNYDAFWQARNPRPHLKNVMPAVMTVGGQFDAEDCFGAWNVYKAIETQNKQSVSNRLVMGPWCHGCWARTDGSKLGNVSFESNTSAYYQSEIEFPFFEYYLKGNGDMKLADAMIFETGSNTWTTHSSWPPKEAKQRTYYLQANGGLSTTRPRGTESADTYISDPANPVPYTEDVHLKRTREYMVDDQRFASRRPDVLVYDTGILEEDISVAGPITADLWVSISGTDADFVVKLIDVFPNDLEESSNGVPLAGYQMLVRGEVLRGRFRNSFESPEAFQPNTPTKVRFQLPDVAHKFKKGHRLMIQIQSSWYPLVDRNPQQFINIYEAEDADFIKAEHTIFHSASKPSAILLNVLD